MSQEVLPEALQAETCKDIGPLQKLPLPGDEEEHTILSEAKTLLDRCKCVRGSARLERFLSRTTGYSFNVTQTCPGG